MSLAELVTQSLRRSAESLYSHRLWTRLVGSGVDVKRDELMTALLGIQSIGEVQVSQRRWSYSASEPKPPRSSATSDASAIATPKAFAPGQSSQLLAIRAAVSLGDSPAARSIEPPPGNLTANWDLFRKLLPYYSECLRVSANTGLTQFSERHRVQFQLVRPETAWWPRPPAWPVLSVAVSDLDPAFIEGLYNRRQEPVFLGYPTEVFRTKESGFAIRPIAILRTDWRLEGDRVVFRVTDQAATFNPDWLQGVRQNRRVARVLDWLGTGNAESDDGVSSVDTSEWASLEDLARSLSMFMARDVRETLDPHRPCARLDLAAGNGVYNVSGLYLVAQNRYTAGVRRDLAALTSWSDEDLEKTALSAIFGRARHTGNLPVLPPIKLEEDQIVAARQALSSPLTVITGPPGTGKSQAASAIMASAALAGKSALFSSRQHQALDAVEGRFHDMLPDRIVLARSRPDRDGDFDFRTAINALLAKQSDATPISKLKERLDPALVKWQNVERHLSVADKVQAATDRYGQAEGDLARILIEQQKPANPASISHGEKLPWWIRLIRAFLPQPFAAKKLVNLARQDKRPISLKAAEQQLQKAEAEHKLIYEEAARLETGQSLPDAVEDLRATVSELLPLLADTLEAVSADERERLANLRGQLGLSRDAETARQLWSNNADILTKHFPLWAVTALSVPSRIPLQPALFDYVVIDEATTCDVASAIPLLARARQAVIVGDPMQTGLVSDLDPSRERPLLEKAGLWTQGIGRFSFSQTSLFDLVSSTSSASRHMLRDHFRCQSEIADFISETFYGRRLTVLTNEKRLRAPAGTKPGLHWTDVTGQIMPSGKGCVSDAEAIAIADHLHLLLERQGFSGTVGVVTPFKKQAERIRQHVEQKLSSACIDRADLRIATGHSFQGDARDVILISPCFGSAMPPGSIWFIRQGASLFNVAVSRARAVCHVFGNLAACEASDIRHLSLLARRINSPPVRQPKNLDRSIFESPWEERLFLALKARGIETIPQYPIAGRRLDLAIATDHLLLDIEVDGDAYHRDPDGFRKVSDIWRDHQLKGLGWRVIRFWVYELKGNMEGCVDRVANELRK